MGVGGQGPIVMNIHSLEPLDLIEHLLLVRNRIVPIDELGIQSSYLCHITTWDNLKQ